MGHYRRVTSDTDDQSLAGSEFRPVLRARDRVAPASAQFVHFRPAHVRIEYPLDLPLRVELIGAPPETHSQPREICGPQRRGLMYARAHHGNTEHVRLK